MAQGDLDRILVIEQAVFRSPWSRASFEIEVSGDPASLSWVAELGGALVGYLISWHVADELHIGNIAVAPVAQGRGVATELLRSALSVAAARGIAYATLEVRVSNQRAIRIYERFGFGPVAIRKRYYTDDGEDALVMAKDLAGAQESR
jgi:ribosomal-protein-alanine N-acetyltransferase